MKLLSRQIIIITEYLLVTCAAASEPRRIISLNDDWRFIRRDAFGAESLSFDDSEWRRISLPHTWNATDGQDGGNDYYRGVGWYRKQVFLAKEHAGRSVYLKFDAASIATKVYVNGSFVGEHKGSFGAFCFDVSNVVQFGRHNVVAVQVSNAFDSTIAPLRGDFTMFGGIYRGVHLLILSNVSISPVDYASSGVYIGQQSVTKEKAELLVTIKLRNDSRSNARLRMRYSIFDQHGNLVSSREMYTLVRAGSKADALGNLIVTRPHLWNGVKDPYLYAMKVEVFSRNILVDSVTEPLGLRFLSVDANKGFFLNGEPYKLYGVNRHQDREDKGWAITTAEHREDFALIKEIGANAVRLAHYQHAKEFYSLCDSGGVMVWAELALVDYVNDSPVFFENCKSQMFEMIKQNYNHPSIFCWALFNELIPENDPSLYERIASEFNALSKHLDPTRPTAAASRSKYDGSVGINRCSDLIGFNVYRGWYEPDPNDFALFMDSMHKKFPELKLAVGEYGAGAGIHSHEFPAKLHPPAGKWHPEEWQSYLHEIVWKSIAQREYIWGSFVWNMFDFASDARSEGELNGRNDKGIVTFDRKTRKDAFYWYKAQWNSEPMVHITEKRFSPRPSGTTTVKVYSNCESVELFVDGKSLGQKHGDDKIFRWQDVALDAVKHDLVARAQSRGTVCADSCTWRTQLN